MTADQIGLPLDAAQFASLIEAGGAAEIDVRRARLLDKQRRLAGLMRAADCREYYRIDVHDPDSPTLADLEGDGAHWDYEPTINRLLSQLEASDDR